MSARPAKKREFASLAPTPFRGVTLLRARFVTHTYERHSHDTFCLGLTHDGVQAFRCRGAEHSCLPEGIMAFNPDEPHDGHAGVPEGYAYHMLYLDPAVVREWMTEAAGTAVPLGYFSRPVISDRHLAAKLRRAIVALKQPAETLRGETLLIHSILSLFERWASPRTLDRPPVTARWVSRVRDYLEEHYPTDITVGVLSEICGVSRVHVTRAFAAAYGMPPHSYLNSIRIRHAKRLLQAGIPPAAVAVDVGYADQSHFTRRFKGSVGVTPSVWSEATGPGLRT